MRTSLLLAGLIVATTLRAATAGEVCNVKIVTDANPDYHDVGGMIHSITANWPDARDRCWALFHWNHIARRQTAPMILHGHELADPIRQFNDYGYTMCSTISGINCGIWGAMGLNVKFWDISLHTVPEVEYDGRYHMYDNSMSAIYTLCDGRTIAGVTDIGADGACPASGNKTEPGHIARYHCLNATSPNGFLTGADCPRSVAEEYKCFNPPGLKYCYYHNGWDLGHRYILNLRDREVYTRCYHRTDADSRNAVAQSDKNGGYLADPAYFVPNNGKDPEAVNPRYHIRGNGRRTWSPSLLQADRGKGIVASAGGPWTPVEAGRDSWAIFRVEGSNVITRLTIKADFFRKTAGDVNAVSVSTTNGLTWKQVWANDKVGETPTEITLLDEVNGAYDVLVNVQLLAKADRDDAHVKSLRFEATTMLNSKTQPSLRRGRNTVYVGTGEPTESIVVWPDLRGESYKPYVVEEKNVASGVKHPGYMGVMFAASAKEDAYVVFRIDAPGDIATVTYGGRFYNRARDSHIDLLHSTDGGKTWTKSYSLTDTTPPWDVIHYETARDIPAGTRSVLFKYLWNSSAAGSDACSMFAVRMEADYKPADATFKPLEVTFAWSERQADYSLVRRSHTQLVEKVPFTYTINVGGADHPVVDSLRVNLAGAAGAAKTGYSDGRDAHAQAPPEKFQDRWARYGRNLAAGKPYTCSIPSENNWGAGDADGRILTDGVVGPPYSGGAAYRWGALWNKGKEPVITVDLGQVEQCAAFRIHVGGYPFWDALRGQVKDRAEVLTSTDGKEFVSRGQVDFNLRWKDLPVNHMWPDDEAVTAHNFELLSPTPVGARYVRFKLTPQRFMSVSEVEVLDSIRYEPFDLKLALPDGQDRSDLARYNPRHTPSTPYRPGLKTP